MGVEAEPFELGPSPREVPLAYPGRIPRSSGLLVGDQFFAMAPRPGRRLGQHRVAIGTLLSGFDDTGGVCGLGNVLDRLNAARIDDRFPVLAIGSNAAPAQLVAKFRGSGLSLVLPMVRARVHGWRVTIAANVSTPGYIATNVKHDPHAPPVDLTVLFCDRWQRHALDDTEPNYARLVAPDDTWLELDGGETLRHFSLYASEHGSLADGHGRILPWADEVGAIRAFMQAVPEGRSRWGDSPESFVVACRHDPELREWARRRVHSRGRAVSPVESRRDPATRYGVLGAPTAPGGLVVRPSQDGTRRRGEPSLAITDAARRDCAIGSHAVVANGLDPRAPVALARVIRREGDDHIGALDQLLRNAIGVEVGEHIELRPARSRQSRLGNLVFGRPEYLLCRVQPADLISAERQACLLDDMSLQLLGIESGDWVVIEGVPADEGVAPKLVIKAFLASDAVLVRRVGLSGGDYDSRFPSALAALGVYPDLPWVFLDSDRRASLGLCDPDGVHQKLGVVRLRARRRSLLLKEVRELTQVVILTVIGLLLVAHSLTVRVVTVAATAVLLTLIVLLRLRSRFIQE